MATRCLILLLLLCGYYFRKHEYIPNTIQYNPNNGDYDVEYQANAPGSYFITVYLDGQVAAQGNNSFHILNTIDPCILHNILCHFYSLHILLPVLLLSLRFPLLPLRCTSNPLLKAIACGTVIGVYTPKW